MHHEFEIYITGAVIEANEAKSMGLVTSVVPPAKLDDEVMRIADRISSIPKNQLMMQVLSVVP